MRTIEINIGGHNEVVRWWSRDYWKMRKFRQREFSTAVAARERMWVRVLEMQKKARAGPRTGSEEWVRLRAEELEMTYRDANLEQIEEVMPGADARRVSAFLAYEKSWKKRLNTWAREKAWRGAYWRTTNLYLAVMNAGVRVLIRNTSHVTSLYDLNSAEKIRVGRLKGDGYHGIGDRQRPNPRLHRRYLNAPPW